MYTFQYNDISLYAFEVFFFLSFSFLALYPFILYYSKNNVVILYVQLS